MFVYLYSFCISELVMFMLEAFASDPKAPVRVLSSV